MQVPKSLRNPEVLAARLSEIDAPHVYGLNAFVRQLRDVKGNRYSIPYFDPHDGGSEGEILFLLEAPGPSAKETGIVSRDNPDETAKNILELNFLANLDRKRTIQWNIVPWFIGKTEGSKETIRAATVKDINEGMETLMEVISLLPRLKTVVLVGNKAAKAAGFLLAKRPELHISTMPHPSPVFINRARDKNRSRILEALNRVSQGTRSDA